MYEEISGNIAEEKFKQLKAIAKENNPHVSDETLVEMLVDFYISSNGKKSSLNRSLYGASEEFLNEFVKDYLEPVDVWIRTELASELYRYYLKLCSENKHAPVGKRIFYNKLKEQGHLLKPSTGNKLYVYGCQRVEDEWL